MACEPNISNARSSAVFAGNIEVGSSWIPTRNPGLIYFLGFPDFAEERSAQAISGEILFRHGFSPRRVPYATQAIPPDLPISGQGSTLCLVLWILNEIPGFVVVSLEIVKLFMVGHSLICWKLIVRVADIFPPLRPDSLAGGDPSTKRKVMFKEHY